MESDQSSTRAPAPNWAVITLSTPSRSGPREGWHGPAMFLMGLAQVLWALTALIEVLESAL